jgi:predicted nuclease with TOPRIM domain
MATEKTPDYKRIARAEQSALDWKTKATQRREENERLKERLETLESKAARLDALADQATDTLRKLKRDSEMLSKRLEQSNQTIITQQNEILELKKKHLR